METLLKIVFAINIVLLIVHEMDAIHWKEWRILFRMNDDHQGRNIFLVAHLPFFMILLLGLLYSDATFGRVMSLITGIFLTVHYFVHRKALAQGLFAEKVSFGVISAMLVGSIVQITLTVTTILTSTIG
jgi:hypothetical protein